MVADRLSVRERATTDRHGDGGHSEPTRRDGSCPDCHGTVTLTDGQYACIDCGAVLGRRETTGVTSDERYDNSGKWKCYGGYERAYDGDGEYQFGSLSDDELLSNR